MMLEIRPLCDKIIRKNNSTGKVVKKSCSVLLSVLDFCGGLKVRILSLFHWNKIAYVYPVPSVVTLHYRSLRESLDNDKEYHSTDDSAKLSPKKIIDGPVGSYERAEDILSNILLVDDDKDILFTFKSILEAEGYNVQAFADPHEALRHYIQMEPSYYNLVLTDIRMPNFSGFQFYQELKEINSDIRVIFMTAFDVPGNLADTMPAIKESDIIKKPIEEEHFVNKIREVLRKGRI